MNHLEIENLKLEARILILLIIKILKKMDSNNHLTIDHLNCKNEISGFENEYIKLKNLEMVLAVVGTMKAGKSTTINAIVGSEILPNRNAPMTAIPTLIKHTPGQKSPRLLFTEKAGQLNRTGFVGESIF